MKYDFSYEKVDRGVQRHNMETPTIYRYNLSKEIIDAIRAFAQLHKFDDRKKYKEAWQSWCSDNNEQLHIEIARLEGLGYDGDVLDKMYKAGRYYFRKRKKNGNLNPEASSNPNKRREYINMSKDVVSAMDTHIKTHIEENDFTPASGYMEFTRIYIDMLRDEADRLGNHIRNSDDIQAKMKKTYKNRYFIISRAK